MPPRRGGASQRQARGHQRRVRVVVRAGDSNHGGRARTNDEMVHDGEV